MRTIILAAAVSAASLFVAACGDADKAATENAVASDGVTNDSGTAAGDAGTENASAAGGSASTTASTWPRGARIVEEGGVTYRVDADGTRVQLGDTDARILVEDGVRYRVEPSGTRVRIDDRGLDVDLPLDVDVGVNRKGNLDVDVSTNGSDATPDR